VILGVGGERGPHRIFRYVSYGHACGIAAGDQTSDGDEVLTVGLHSVRRGFTGLAVVEEWGEPVGERISLRRWIGDDPHGRSTGEAKLT
jgi:hypothetical protein